MRPERNKASENISVNLASHAGESAHVPLEFNASAYSISCNSQCDECKHAPGASVVHVSGSVIFVSADTSRGSSCTVIVVVVGWYSAADWSSE